MGYRPNGVFGFRISAKPKPRKQKVLTSGKRVVYAR